MPKELIKHASHPQQRWSTMSGTLCGRMMPNNQTVADPRDATCKLCLTHVTKQGKLEMCTGCNENFYNGNNDLGVKECWNLEKAHIVHKKKIGINDVPPWKTQPVVRMLSCRREKGYIFVEPKQEH